MTTTLDIITDAYRESNIIGMGVQLTDGQKTEGLRRLNAVVSSVLGFEVGEKLHDWQVGTLNQSQPNWFNGDWSLACWHRPQANVRLVVSSAVAVELFLPTKISDGARIGLTNPAGNLAAHPVTLNANGRTIEGAASIVLDTDDLQTEWFYRADLSDWVRRELLTIDGDFIYPAEFDDAFVTMLAMRVNPRYGRAISAETAAWMDRSVTMLKSRYHQKTVTAADLAVLMLSSQAYQPYLGRGRGGFNGWMN